MSLYSRSEFIQTFPLLLTGLYIYTTAPRPERLAKEDRTQPGSTL